MTEEDDAPIEPSTPAPESAGGHGDPGDEFWKVARPLREPLDRPWFPVAVVTALVLATPWYLPGEIAARLWHGLPVWVWMSLAGALSLSCLTAFGALRLWRSDEFEGRRP